MDIVWKKKWIEALRSGKYKQGRAALKEVRGKTAKYCCLGVLCDLAARDGLIRRASKPLYDVSARDFEGNSGALPDHLRERLEMEKKDQSHLISMNDVDEASFSKIADWIEANL